MLGCRLASLRCWRNMCLIRNIGGTNTLQSRVFVPPIFLSAVAVPSFMSKGQLRLRQLPLGSLGKRDTTFNNFLIAQEQPSTFKYRNCFNYLVLSLR